MPLTNSPGPKIRNQWTGDLKNYYIFLRYMISLYATISILFLCCCSKTTEREPPETPSEVLNEVVRSAAYQYINLDELQLQEIILSENDIIYSVNGEVHHDEPLLGHISTSAYRQANFYIYDLPSAAIYKVSKEGAIEGPLTREGRGPGEHNIVGNLKGNTRHIYATDLNNARINRYTHEMEPVDPIPGFQHSPSSSLVDLNDERMLTGNRNSGGFSPVNPEQGLISVSPVDNLSDTIATIMPRIIPVGYQPMSFNNTSFSINSHNRIAASYAYLPWIFLFDEDNSHVLTLILEYSAFDEMNIPSMEIFRPQGNEGFGGANPVTRFRLMDDGDIFLTIYRKHSDQGKPRELIRLTPSGDNSYKAVGKYNINYYGSDDVMWSYDSVPVSDGDNTLFYGRTPEYLFRFTLPDGKNSTR